MSDKKHSVLLVEDDEGLRSQLRWALSNHFEVTVAGDRKAAMTEARAALLPVVVLDLGLPPDANGATEGLATLESILQLRPESKVIIASGNEERENAVKAIAKGAYDFYSKPVDVDVLSLLIERAWHVYTLEKENRRLQEMAKGGPFDHLITADDAMVKVCRTIEKVARTDVTVLITGESGTGKELIANALHQCSPRAKNPFVAINCAAIPENLLESELFGHEKGAFTGAVKQTIGKVEQADKGTLFLDEIGDLPQSLQAKLLRFLQERNFERLGGRKSISVDVRIVCATHQNLDNMMADGSFRQDLFFRLNEINVHIPALRERPADWPLLAKFFLHRFNKEYKRNVRGLSDAALNAVASHNWPGNVREFENRIKKAVIMSEEKFISAEDLELASSEGEAAPIKTLKQARDEADRLLIRQVLAHTNGNVSKTAKLIGTSRPTLYDMLADLGISNGPPS